MLYNRINYVHHAVNSYDVTCHSLSTKMGSRNTSNLSAVNIRAFVKVTRWASSGKVLNSISGPKRYLPFVYTLVLSTIPVDFCFRNPNCQVHKNRRIIPTNGYISSPKIQTEKYKRYPNISDMQNQTKCQAASGSNYIICLFVRLLSINFICQKILMVNKSFRIGIYCLRRENIIKVLVIFTRSCLVIYVFQHLCNCRDILNTS